MTRIANLSLVQLQYLTALDEHRHFIKAAQSCFVTQPTLSMQIKKLEEELDVKLFDRSKHPIIPTDVGVLIIEQAKKVLNETRKIENILLDYKGKISGDLNIGIIPTISPYLMPQLISQISKRYPEIRLNVRELMTDEIVSLLQKDHLDVGIVATPLEIDGMVEKPIFYEKFCLYLNPSHPAYHLDQLEDAKVLLEDKLWLLSEGNCFRDQAVNLCALKHSTQLKNSFNYESGSIETLIRIVNLEGGATVIPEWASLNLRQEEMKHIRQVKGNSVREVSLIYTRNFAKAKLSEAFYTTLQASVPIQLKKNVGKKIVSLA
ncbi:MAG: LysR family hydrogen peroxide-inducible transcriptional activator [bacterium]|jgi:LysR family hydrogen peroxide-inducible transcriptional activator